MKGRKLCFSFIIIIERRSICILHILLPDSARALVQLTQGAHLGHTTNTPNVGYDRLVLLFIHESRSKVFNILTEYIFVGPTLMIKEVACRSLTLRYFLFIVTYLGEHASLHTEELAFDSHVSEFGMDVLFVQFFAEFSGLRDAVDHVYHELSLFTFLLDFTNKAVIVGHPDKSEPGILVVGHRNVRPVHFPTQYQHEWIPLFELG